jgi:glycosyltransferase involved in cell wall biosynthesis
MGQAAPCVSVVVMTFNRPDGLRRCLSSLAAQSLDPQIFEVVVVDVSSPPVDQVLEPFQQRLQLSHQPVPNRGVAANRNLGAERARGEVLAFLDDDCIASPTWLAELLVGVQRDPNVLVGAPTVHPTPTSATAAAGQVITELVDGFFNPVGQEPGFLPGLNFALNRDRFLEIGGCDSRFGFLAAEDRDLIDRWQRAGGRLELCFGDARVRHEHRASLRGFVRQYFNYGRGAWHFHRLRQRSSQGRLMSDARLHMTWPRLLAKPMSKVPSRMRLQVLLLIAVWQVANVAGFLWQSAACRGESGKSWTTP